MNIYNLGIGIGLYLAAYLYYIWMIKNNPPASVKTQGRGPVLPVYVGLWGALILLLIAGTAYIIKAL